MNLFKLKFFLQTHHYSISIIVILLLATLFRFYNYHQHWGLGNDDARDALIGRVALERKELPIIGPFSSAGPFVFGPLFYWVIMASYILLPFAFTAPWIITGLTSVAVVFILMQIGKTIGGRNLAIILGVLAATSPQMIFRSLSLGPHSYVPICASLLILNLILLWQKQKTKYALFMGLALGTGLSMHYQIINLLIFFPALLLIPQIKFKRKLLMLCIMLIGFLIPSLPLLIWEAKQEFANTRNILDYILIAQYRLYVPNSWRLFLIQFFPNYWAFVMGGQYIIGFLLMTITPLLLTYSFAKKKLPGTLLTLGTIFLILVIVNRYYKGERSEGYLLYMLPFILIFSAYGIYTLITQELVKSKIQKLIPTIGTLILVAVITGNLMQIQKHLAYQTPVSGYEKGVEELIKKYPDKKFSVYDYQWKQSAQSQPLSFLLERRGKIDKDGMPIGFSCNTLCDQSFPEIASLAGYPVLDLSSEKNLTTDSNWVNVNPDSMYDDLMSWSKTRRLKSNFTFFN